MAQGEQRRIGAQIVEHLGLAPFLAVECGTRQAFAKPRNGSTIGCPVRRHWRPAQPTAIPPTAHHLSLILMMPLII
jgi:hypothetical protein